MNCVKCGRDTAENQVFCDLCLETMEKYPVKPGTAVHIPHREEEHETRKNQPRKKLPVPLGEQVLRLKKKLLRTRIALAVVLLLCGVLCFLASEVVRELDLQRLMGQNYSTVETTNPTEPASETTVP